MNENNGLPKGWVKTLLPEIAQINPPRGDFAPNESGAAHFVPMACVCEEFGGIDVSSTRPLSEVIKGYTAFQEDDVLFAKITPCMENGKIAVVPKLEYGLGFGSTEFHVLRATKVVLPAWIAHFLSQSVMRRNAQRSMTGSAGQLRVPKLWLIEQQLPLPPLNEQRRIVAKIEELFSDLDAGVAALERAKAKLKRYRAAVLKAAVEGRLTTEWRRQQVEAASRRFSEGRLSERQGTVRRTQNGEGTRQDAESTYEPAPKLLGRILKERRRKWEAEQLRKFEEAGKQPPKNWKDKYKEPQPVDESTLPALPEGWCWASVEQVAEHTRYGSSAKTNEDDSGIPVLRMGNIVDGTLDFGNLKYLPNDHAEFPELLLQRGDLLFNRTNSAELVGKSAVYEGKHDPCSYASYLISVRCLPGCNPRVLCCYLNSTHGRRWVKSVVSQQVGQANVNGSKLQALAFPLPPALEQQRIVAAVEEAFSQIDHATATVDMTLRRASRLRQSILKRAFEGKLVPQDPEDEPAIQLLERIQSGREKHAAGSPSTNGRSGPRTQKRIAKRAKIRRESK